MPINIPHVQITYAVMSELTLLPPECQSSSFSSSDRQDLLLPLPVPWEVSLSLSRLPLPSPPLPRWTLPVAVMAAPLSAAVARGQIGHIFDYHASDLM